MSKLFSNAVAKIRGGNENNPSPWLTNDGEERKVLSDPFCPFKFTVSAMVI